MRGISLVPLSCMVALLSVLVFPSPAPAVIDVCKQLVDRKEYDLAVKECTAMLSERTYPADEAYNNRGIAYAGKGQYDKAVEDYSRAISLDPQFSKAYNNRGNAYWHLGRHDDSIKDYQRAIEISPNDPNAYYNLACRFALRKDAEEACSWLRKAIDKGFSNWEHIKQDSDLDSIRSAPCYKAIVGGR